MQKIAYDVRYIIMQSRLYYALQHLHMMQELFIIIHICYINLYTYIHILFFIPIRPCLCPEDPVHVHLVETLQESHSYRHCS